MAGFKDLHPAILFLYYVVVIFTTIITLNPVMLTLSLIGAVLYYGLLSSRKECLKSIFFYLVVLAIIALTNPMFSHNGETVLIYINDNPITLESIIYGIFAGVMIVGVMFWCKCYERVMSTDKFLYLFGKAAPKISITISMSVRFIPDFKRQAENVSDVQKIMGIEERHGKISGRLRVYESVLGRAMENSVDTADAMAARGFGIKRRTNYSIFRFTPADAIMSIYLFLYIVVFMAGIINKVYDFSYYPITDSLGINRVKLLFYSMHGVLIIIPYLYTLIQNYIIHKLQKGHLY